MARSELGRASPWGCVEELRRHGDQEERGGLPWDGVPVSLGQRGGVGPGGGEAVSDLGEAARMRSGWGGGVVVSSVWRPCVGATQVSGRTRTGSRVAEIKKNLVGPKAN